VSAHLHQLFCLSLIQVWLFIFFGSYRFPVFDVTQNHRIHRSNLWVEVLDVLVHIIHQVTSAVISATSSVSKLPSQILDSEMDQIGIIIDFILELEQPFNIRGRSLTYQ